MSRIALRLLSLCPLIGKIFLVGSIFLTAPHAVMAHTDADNPFTVVARQPSPLQGITAEKPLNLSTSIYERVAIEHGIDPLILYAVVLIESGRIEGQMVRPWIWALNREGKSLYPESSAAALDQIRHQLKAGSRNIDIGLMQVNLRWHRHRVGKVEDLLDPVTNIELGAQILQEAIATVPRDLVLGVGRYHAWSNPSEARKYGGRVLRLAARLRELARHGG